MTQTLLPFVLKGISEVVDIEHKKSTEFPIHTKCIPSSRLDSMYSIPEKHLSKDEIARHKRNLTMIPIDNSFSNQTPVQFNAYESENGILSVPRFYGIENWGTAEIDDTSIGEPMNAHNFAGKLNPIQNDACSTTLSRLNGPNKGGIVVLPCGYGKTVC